MVNTSWTDRKRKKKKKKKKREREREREKTPMLMSRAQTGFFVCVRVTVGRKKFQIPTIRVSYMVSILKKEKKSQLNIWYWLGR